MSRQHKGREFPDDRIVFDEQDDLAATDLDPGPVRGRWLAHEPVTVWQIDLECRPLLQLAAHEDEAPELSDRAIDGGETQAGALAFLFRREERLEDCVSHLFQRS